MDVAKIGTGSSPFLKFDIQHGGPPRQGPHCKNNTFHTLTEFAKRVERLLNKEMVPC